MTKRTKTPNTEYSKNVGRYVGSVLFLLFLSELFTLNIYRQPVSVHTVYLNGFILLIFGAYIIAKHNIWTKHWPVLITLSGWIMTILGLYRLFFPAAPQAPVGTSTYVTLVILLIIELFIVIKSFSR